MWTFFYYLPGGLENLNGHRLLADKALQLLHLLLELSNPAGRDNILARCDCRRPAVLYEAHPVAEHAGRDPELPRELCHGLLTRDDPGDRLPLESDREDPPTVGLPREFLHLQLPFWGPFSAPKCLAEMGGRPASVERDYEIAAEVRRRSLMVDRRPGRAVKRTPDDLPEDVIWHGEEVLVRRVASLGDCGHVSKSICWAERRRP